MSATSAKVAATVSPATVAAPVATVTIKAARFSEGATITLLAAANPKKAASAKRFAGYGSKVGDTTTVKAYLDHCLAVQPDEPRYRWRADLAWDVKRGFITVA